MTLDLFKEVLPSILQTKKNVLTDPNDIDSYVPFVVNRGLSFHMDCVPYANEMNKYPNLDKDMQYNYLLHSVRGMKRKFQPWQKADVIKNIESVMTYYGFSAEKAKEAMKILTESQLKEIIALTDVGGVKTKNS